MKRPEKRARNLEQPAITPSLPAHHSHADTQGSHVGRDKIARLVCQLHCGGLETRTKRARARNVV